MKTQTQACLAMAALLVLAPVVKGDSAAMRQRLLMDSGWRFKLGDPADAGNIFEYPEPGSLDKTRPGDLAEVAKLEPTRKDPVALNLGANVSYARSSFDDRQWRQLDLPHDWVVELPFGGHDVSHGRKDIDPKKGTNIGWYRRTFDLPATDKNKTLWLEFDGIYRNSLIWLNGHCLGRHISGYSGFKLDITEHANFGGQNTLVVRVDATRNEGWFYEGGGIYRHVWLVKTDPIHVAHWGTYVTSTVNDADADVTIQTQLQNDSTQTVSAALLSSILDADGKIVTESEPAMAALEPGKEQTISQKMKVKNPHLWSVETPYLYKLVTTIKRDTTVADVYETPFGIRTLRFDPNQGFFLNGKHVYVKGTCNHQDHAGVGSALPDRIQYFRIEKLKEMGGNAYRTSHNPPTPELLDACDRLGMLVMDENRQMDDTPETLGQLERLIRRDRNHPSIIIWSLGNEEFQIQGNDDIGSRIARVMQDLVHKLDPTRPVTVAMNGAWGRGFSRVIDVMGFNYFVQGDMDKFHNELPGKPCIGSEEASTLCTRGAYANDPKACFMSAYDDNAPKWGSTTEKWWKYYLAQPWVAGAFVWTGFDYRGEPTPYNDAFSSQFGIMDTCGFPKDNFYFYQAWWSDKTVLHLLPHWNWPGKEDQEIDVRCFSNCDEVELLLNSQSLGRQAMPLNSHLAWKVKYAPGSLAAKGFKGGKEIASTEVATTGAPAGIKLFPDRAIINADGEDVSIVTVAVVDAQGHIVPVASDEVSFAVTGGRIIGVGNGHPNTQESDKLPKRTVFNGLAQVIVQSTKQPGSIILKATSPQLQAAELTIESKSCTPCPSVP
jgi:beta-galactosidase